MNHILRFAFAIVLVAMPSLSMGQQAGAETGKPVKRGVRFICTEIAPDTPSTLKLLGKKGIEEVELSTRAPSDLFEISAEGLIVLGEASNDPENPIKALAKGTLPATTKRATALLIPGKDRADGMKYEMFLIPDDDLKGGSAYFLNLIDNICVAKLDDKKLELKKDKPVIFQPEDLKEARNSPIAIVVETREDGKQAWRLLMSSTWRLRATRIEVCIVYWNEEVSRPSIKGLTLFPMDPDKDE